ncbi:DUF485 domain-containing protein [Brachybacterium fresconis]|uniref:Uncharacterized membrane protein (DUF485 family) n=1 Tax=Brachybacterium fresconis TaxID=173363 RepID=A0ABS4YMI0_9MICO|nr:uncharacterized membrane protein (DUF485 family) [Brachybacterium fresconis]
MTTPSPGPDGPAPDRVDPDQAQPDQAQPDQIPPDQIPSDEISPETFRTVQSSEEFTQLRRSFRGFAIPMTIAFLVWYLAYVLLSTYAEGFMSLQVIGNLNLGIILGLSQFLMTFLITWLYIRHANRSLDPISTRIRDELEGAN